MTVKQCVITCIGGMCLGSVVKLQEPGPVIRVLLAHGACTGHGWDGRQNVAGVQAPLLHPVRGHRCHCLQCRINALSTKCSMCKFAEEVNWNIRLRVDARSSMYWELSDIAMQCLACSLFGQERHMDIKQAAADVLNYARHK